MRFASHIYLPKPCVGMTTVPFVPQAGQAGRVLRGSLSILPPLFTPAIALFYFEIRLANSYAFEHPYRISNNLTFGPSLVRESSPFHRARCFQLLWPLLTSLMPTRSTEISPEPVPIFIGIRHLSFDLSLLHVPAVAASAKAGLHAYTNRTWRA